MDNNHKPEVHEFDGIIEEDNQMPHWWIALFLGTIIFAFLYWTHYTFGGGDSLKTEYLKAAQSMKALQKNSNPADNISEEVLALFEQNSEALVSGKQLFTEKCAMCHGPELQGTVGPNLVDSFWIHGQGTRKDIYVVIQKGVLDKGMPAWSEILKDDEVKAIVAFIYSKKGSNPANPKAPQGEKVAN